MSSEAPSEEGDEEGEDECPRKEGGEDEEGRPKRSPRPVAQVTVKEGSGKLTKTSHAPEAPESHHGQSRPVAHKIKGDPGKQTSHKDGALAIVGKEGVGPGERRRAHQFFHQAATEEPAEAETEGCPHHGASPGQHHPPEGAEEEAVGEGKNKSGEGGDEGLEDHEQERDDWRPHPEGQEKRLERLNIPLAKEANRLIKKYSAGGKE